MTTKDLTANERTVLAGSLAYLVQAEGSVQDGEIAGIETVRNAFAFDDLDEHLEQFREAMGETHDPDERDRRFDSLVLTVTRPEAQTFILERLDAVSRMDAYRDPSEEAFMNHLRLLWKVETA
ncbi:MAG: hypothetical protein ACLFNQ_13415 [Spirochaetaceae bacterium]